MATQNAVPFFKVRGYADGTSSEALPLGVIAGERTLGKQPLGKRVTAETVQQCTGCAFRFDCDEYRTHLGPSTKSRDVDIYTVFKN